VGPETQILETIAPGILWLGALLACLLSLDRIFQLDWEDGTLDLLATAPVPLEGRRGDQGAVALDHHGPAAGPPRARSSGFS
jgi:heme exporter protein CcmB